MLNIQHLNNPKGLTSKEDIGIIPLGKKGETRKYNLLSGGMVTMDYGSKINDTDRRNVITCMSLMLERLGYDQTNEVIKDPLVSILPNGQIAYTTFSIKASDVSTLLYGNTREGRLVTKSLKNVAHLMIEVATDETQKAQNIFNQVSNIVYKNGVITFDVANMMIQTLAETRLPYRKEKTLLNNGFDYRLSFYVETHQQSKDGKKWYPRQTYRLDDLIEGLALKGTYRNVESIYIDMIQEAFNNIAKRDKDFPGYIYDKEKRFFYNKHKKGAKQDLFSSSDLV